jgi:hypothetical protein
MKPKTKNKNHMLPTQLKNTNGFDALSLTGSGLYVQKEVQMAFRAAGSFL